MTQFRLGLAAMFFKLGGKILGISLKVLKSPKVVKVGLAAASVVTYSLFVSWQFAIAICVTIAWHEFGHSFQMRREGMKVKGIYLIPIFGGVTTSEDTLPSHAADVRITLAGPYFGFLLAAASLGLYIFTGDPLFAAITSLSAIINLVNLLPIFPLDGGRVMRACALSLNSKASLVYLAGTSILLASLVTAHLKNELLLLVVVYFVIDNLNLLPLIRKKKIFEASEAKPETSLDKVEPSSVEIEGLLKAKNDGIPLMTAFDFTYAGLLCGSLIISLILFIESVAGIPGTDISSQILK